MKNQTFFPTLLRFAAFILAIFQWQCSHYYYAPPLPNVPILKAKNDIMVSFSGSLQEKTGGVAVQSAVSPFNHWVVGADYNYISGSDHKGGDGYYGNGSGNLLSLSTGYYHFYPTPNHPNRGGHLMLIGGVSFGSASQDYYNIGLFDNNGYKQTGESHLNYNHYFIQPSLAWKSPALEVIFSTRYVWIHYSKVEFINYSSWGNTDQPAFENNRYYFSFEPTWTLRAGWPAFKFQFQLARLVMNSMPAAKANFGLGLLFYRG